MWLTQRLIKESGLQSYQTLLLAEQQQLRSKDKNGKRPPRDIANTAVLAPKPRHPF
jgi:hypothetical protein